MLISRFIQAAIFTALFSLPASAAEQVEFVLPSGNIGCIYTPQGGTDVYQPVDGGPELSCDRVEPQYVRIILGPTGKAVLHKNVGDASCCSAGPVLSYGKTWKAGPFTCKASTSGLDYLIICHTPGQQALSDFLTVRNIMAGRAPEIEVHVVSVDQRLRAGFWRSLAGRPSLIFSPMPVEVPGTVRGTRLIQAGLTKLEEAEFLARSGFPIPETRLITKDLHLDDATWGALTVIKPNRGYRGKGVRLVETRDVRWLDTSILPPGDPWRNTERLAQRYIDTGPYLSSYRVMTVLGRPIYCMMSLALEKQPGAIAVNDMKRKVALVDEPDILELACAIHAKLPEMPVMGIDIIREEASRRLFVLEFNSPGSTWHISSEHGLKYQREFGLDYYRQFDVLNSIADALIEVTRKRAT